MFHRWTSLRLQSAFLNRHHRSSLTLCNRITNHALITIITGAYFAALKFCGHYVEMHNAYGMWEPLTKTLQKPRTRHCHACHHIHMWSATFQHKSTVTRGGTLPQKPFMQVWLTPQLIPQPPQFLQLLNQTISLTQLA